MDDPTNDTRFRAGAHWTLTGDVDIVIVAAPLGFLLVSWPPSLGMMVHVMPDGTWEYPDRHALAEGLAGASYVGIVGDQ